MTGHDTDDDDEREIRALTTQIGDTATLEVRSHRQFADTSSSSSLTDAQRLVPLRAQLRLAQLRVERWRQ